MGGDDDANFKKEGEGTSVAESHAPVDEPSSELQLAWEEHEDEHLMVKEADTSRGSEDSTNTKTRRRGLTPVDADELFAPDFEADGVTVVTAITLRWRKELPADTGFGKKKTYIRLRDDDAAVVVGRSGRTKQKIAKASGARITLADNLVLDLSGSPAERDCAELYVKLTLRQRQGAIIIDFDERSRNDLTVLHLQPAWVTAAGIVLRQLEEETDTLIFFARPYDGPSRTNKVVEPLNESVDEDMTPDATEKPRSCDQEGTEMLLIFGGFRCRRAAQLRVMGAIEARYSTHFSSMYNAPYNSRGPDFFTDRLPISRSDFKYANGKDGSTRRKIARAANCILEFVGPIAFIAGTRGEVKRGRDYLNWLVKQRHGPVHVSDVSNRSDCTSVSIPSNILRTALGVKPHALRSIETDSHTFCVIDAERNTDRERLLIFSSSGLSRDRARAMIYEWLDRYGYSEQPNYYEYDPRTRMTRRRGSFEDCKRRRRDDDRYCEDWGCRRNSFASPRHEDRRR